MLPNPATQGHEIEALTNMSLACSRNFPSLFAFQYKRTPCSRCCLSMGQTQNLGIHFFLSKFCDRRSAQGYQIEASTNNSQSCHSLKITRLRNVLHLLRCKHLSLKMFVFQDNKHFSILSPAQNQIQRILDQHGWPRVIALDCGNTSVVIFFHLKSFHMRERCGGETCTIW